MSNKSNSIVATMGIDIGKNFFYVVGLDQRGAIHVTAEVVTRPGRSAADQRAAVPDRHGSLRWGASPGFGCSTTRQGGGKRRGDGSAMAALSAESGAERYAVERTTKRGRCIVGTGRRASSHRPRARPQPRFQPDWGPLKQHRTP
jgi:hypothetical protein